MVMTDDLTVISPLDQDVEVADEEGVLDRIREIIHQSIEERDAQKAIHVCYQIVKILKLGGLALAESLYLVHTHWEELGVNDDFEDVIASRTGLHKATVQRYVTTWRELHAGTQVPLEYREKIKQLNIKSQIPIAQALDAGYELEDEDWEAIIEAPDFSSINAHLRDIKGKEPRSHALILMMDRDGGLKAIKNEEQVYVGWLNVDDDNLIVQQAISRITKGSGVLEQ